MKHENISLDVSPLVPFTASVNSHYISKTPETTISGISKNGLWLWIACDTVINVYHSENSEWFGGYCFGESLKNPSAKITSVVEFSSSHVSFPCLLICVNQDHESIICLYNVKASKVYRAILVPDTVCKIEVISSNGGACMDTHHLYIQLRYMFGLVALGTSSGRLYFLDLCLDEEFVCDENLPNITFVVNKYELSPERRERCTSKQQHVFMLLNDQSARNGSFDFESRSSSLGYFPYGKVRVTAIKYIQSTVTLALGFNFGGVQLWGLHDLCLLYTLANHSCDQAVISFAFQEPENDPRNFCYLWVIRGYSANERPEDFSIAAMYSLTFYKRTYVESFGNLYREFQCCSKRFEYPLTSDPFSAAQSSTSVGSCILSCQTVCQTDFHYLDASSANDSDIASENMSLCFLSWHVWSDAGSTPTSYHLALFDLNQWYQAQMPSFNFRSNPSDLALYLAHFSLEEAVGNFVPSPILDLYAISHSIKRFKYLTPSEEFFYPSSLGFQSILYSTTGICKASFVGLQKKMLYEMADRSPHILINPKDFHLDLIRCGLVPDPHGNNDRVPLIAQREALLQLALEYHIPIFFMRCLKEWKYSDSIQEGCTSRALVLWAWKKISVIKNNVDKISLSFFNCSGLDVDRTALRTLHSYRRQLDLIDTIFEGYQKFAAPRTEQGIEELKCRREVTSCLSMYLQVLLWLRFVHVLPEVCEGEETEKNIIYPSSIGSEYLKRRVALQKIHSSIGATDILLIDGFVKEHFSENSWQKLGGNGIYPPPSVYGALSCYLMDGIHLDLKHSIMYYFLLDICNASPNLKKPLTLNVKKFPIVFGMSQSNKKLVKSFWYLDQFNFEAAIKKLLHHAVNPSDILPWQHQRIIKSFLFQREAQKALRYINHRHPPENTVEDMKLHLSVLISRGAITQAFDYQRKKQVEGYGSELLHHLLLGCQETYRLKDVMDLPLNSFESSTLIKFLSENKDPRAQEALVMYHLLRYNFFEASKINEKLSISLSNKNLSTRERTAGRDALVESLLASVPKVEKNLVEEINRFPAFPIKKREVQKPLSMTVKIAPLEQISYTDILNSLICDASSAMCAPYLDPNTPLRTTVRSRFDDIPFLRPPLTPESTRISTEALCITPTAKRSLSSPTSEFASPTKKSRLLDNATFKMPSLMKKKIPKHLAGDVASLLQSPPIPRRSSSAVKESMKNSPAVAPQGILKNKIECPKSPTSDIFTSRTPSVLSDAAGSSDDEAPESEKMIVDAEIAEDLPGKQIRFTVPSKEDLNASALSSVSVDSSIKEECILIEDPPESSGSIRSESKDLKMPSSDSFESATEECISISQKRYPNLTREPLKTRSLLSHDKFPLSSQFKVSCESAAQFKILESISKAPCSYSVEEPKITSTEAFVDSSDSNSCPAIESIREIIPASEDPKHQEHDSKSIPAQLSSDILSSTPSNLEKSELYRSSSSVLDKSGSSSGNSSYNSASERSLIITPRRPLRASSRNTSISDSSMMSAIDDVKDETLCPVVEESDNVGDTNEAFNQHTDSESIVKTTTENDSIVTPETHPVESLSAAGTTGISVTSEGIVDKNIEDSANCDESVNDSDANSVTAEAVVQNNEVEVDIETQNTSQETFETKNCNISEVQNSDTCLPQPSQSIVSEEIQTNIPSSDTSNTTEAPACVREYIPIKERISRSSVKSTEDSVLCDPSIESSSQSEIRKNDFIGASRITSHSSVTPRKSIHSASQTITGPLPSSDVLNTPVEEISSESLCTILSNKNVPPDLSERFHYMSIRNDLYGRKLHRDAMKMLAEDFSYENFKVDMKTKPSRKTKTFVFAKKSESNEAKDKPESTFSTSEINETANKEFLETGQLETYEQFSHSIQKETSDVSSKTTLESSPNTGLEKNSEPLFNIDDKIKQTESKGQIRKKHSTSTKTSSGVVSSIDKTSKLSIKKAKGKGKVSKKIEFSFSEPISPAGPEILEALATPSEHPVGSFMFSPPLTRGRRRQKKIDESLGSSFASVVSETSMVKQKKPPVDPILEEIMAEKGLALKDLRETPTKSKAKSTSKKKSSSKLSRSSILSLDQSATSLDASKLETSQDVLKNKSSLSKQEPKHKMVLRQIKGKPKAIL